MNSGAYVRKFSSWLKVEGSEFGIQQRTIGSPPTRPFPPLHEINNPPDPTQVLILCNLRSAFLSVSHVISITGSKRCV